MYPVLTTRITQLFTFNPFESGNEALSIRFTPETYQPEQSAHTCCDQIFRYFSQLLLYTYCRHTVSGVFPVVVSLGLKLADGDSPDFSFAHQI